MILLQKDLLPIQQSNCNWSYYNVVGHIVGGYNPVGKVSGSSSSGDTGGI
jgi:hypothetical protein